MRLSYLIVAGLLLTACQPSTTEVQGLFDTKQFFTQEIAKLKNKRATLQKQVGFNTLSDSLTLTNEINWENELQLFSELDLAKPTNAKQFTIDTAWNNDESIINYTAIDQAQRIRQIWITLDNNKQVKAIACRTAQKTNLFGSSQYLRYVTDSGFSIYTRQQTQLADDAVYTIAGRIIL